MAEAVTISLSKFTRAVQAAVKSASAKHPKLKMEPPEAVTISYLIRGIPPPESVLSNVTMAELQAFATDVAAQIATAQPEIFERGVSPEGVVLSVGRHVICGIPPVTRTLSLRG
jgi:hypothetical protein